MHQLKLTFIVKHALLWPIDDEHTDAYRDRTPITFRRHTKSDSNFAYTILKKYSESFPFKDFVLHLCF